MQKANILPISDSDINTAVKWFFFITKQADDALTYVRRYLIRRATLSYYSWLNQNIYSISCVSASSLCAISHAIERTSTVPKSKNAEINIKKLKNKHVIIVALWTVAFCNNFYLLSVTPFNLSSNVEAYLGTSLRHVLELSCKNS